MASEQRQKKKISFVIPVYNEEANIQALTKTLKEFFSAHPDYTFEAVIVENGSQDDSFKLLSQAAKKDPRIKILQLSKNFMGDGGIAAGMQHITGDACVIMMADLQEPIELVSDFIKKWQEGYDIVYGIVKKRTAGWLVNIGASLFYRIMSLATGNTFPEHVADFRLIDRCVYEVINQMPEQNKYLRGLIIWTGFKHIGVPFDRRPRVAGESKATFSGLLKVAQNGIFSFSYLPLRFVSYLGFFMTIISFLALIVNLIIVIVMGRQTPGVATIVLLMLLLFGMLFFILGIMSEYIARIYEEAKRRPNYIVKRRINLSRSRSKPQSPLGVQEVE